MDDKYVVLKKADWEAWITSWAPSPTARPGIELDALDDAVVIRTQDAFAAAGLGAYLSTLKLGRTLLADQPMVSDAALSSLERTIDYFAAMVSEAEDRLARGDVKLPD